jgi:hypothetical protein
MDRTLGWIMSNKNLTFIFLPFSMSCKLILQHFRHFLLIFLPHFCSSLFSSVLWYLGHSQSHTRTLSLSFSLALSEAHIFDVTLKYEQMHTHLHTHLHTHTYTHTYTHSLSPPLTFTRTFRCTHYCCKVEICTHARTHTFSLHLLYIYIYI